MKRHCIKTFTLCASILLSGHLFAQKTESVGILSEADLKPFCSNEFIWKSKKVTPEQCLVAAKYCAEKNANAKLNVIEATQTLYSCTFKKLGGKMDFNFDVDNSEEELSDEPQF